MSGQPLRRSERLRRNAPVVEANCETCTGKIRYDTAAGTKCATCFHFTDPMIIQYMRDLNLYWPERLVCLCPCECADDLNDPNDGNFSDDQMDVDEDDLTTQLDDRTERAATARYGFFTNVVLNEDTDRERRVFVEGPAHYAAASSHDIGQPAESSLVNTENTIGRTEVTFLRTPLDPWEAEAIHRSTGLSYNELRRIFPEIATMQTPAPPRADGDEGPWVQNYFCRSCNKSVTDEFMQWLRTGRVIYCLSCGLTRKPENPEEDPDWRDYRIGNFPTVAAALEHCRCRCSCGGPGGNHADAVAQLEVRPVTPTTPTRAIDTESETDYRPPPRHYTYPDAVYRPRLPHILDMNLPVTETTTNAQFIVAWQDRIRQDFGLPNLQLDVEHHEGDAAVLHMIGQIHRQGELAMQARAWDEAYRHLQIAAQAGRYYGNLEDTDDSMIEIFRDLRDVYEHLLLRDTTSRDTNVRGDVEDLLERYDAARANANNDEEEEEEEE